MRHKDNTLLPEGRKQKKKRGIAEISSVYHQELFADINSLLEEGGIHRVFSDSDTGVYLFRGDCLVFMDILIKSFPRGLVDMVFADPPYFLSNGGITCRAGRMTCVNKGIWDRSRGIDENHRFNQAWLLRCQKILKPDGTLWVTGTHHVIYSVGFAMQQLGMKILNDITWEKPNPPPNLSCRYFTHSTETVIWAARDRRSKHLFNYGTMRKLNRGRQMKTVWTIPPPGPDEKHFGKHPTQKPVKLLERIILASTRENDLVFDPFTGSGTTGVAAVNLKRRFVGCELDPTFAELAVKRLKQATQERVVCPEIFGVRR
ncbi:MAG: site-specific DNA-methyltransferase [Candidatus Omnitrophica bacterium]|nr:site-specific DNA-methyltransferase [Candidatus Omnitrophota bacterium]